MNRRRFLATFTTTSLLTTAGCSYPQLTDAPHSPTTAPPDTTTTPPANTTQPLFADTDHRQLGAASVITQQPTDRTYALSPLSYRTRHGALVQLTFTAPATPDHPAHVAATLTNRNDHPTTFDLNMLPPFGQLTSAIPVRPWTPDSHTDLSYRDGLVFAPRQTHALVPDDQPAPPVTQTQTGRWQLATDVADWLPATIRLTPGETIRGEYAVVSHPDTQQTHQPPGIYQFHRAADNAVQISVWPTSAPGPTTPSRFNTTTVPPLTTDGDTADTTSPATTTSTDATAPRRGEHWYHRTTPTTPSYVVPHTEQTALPARLTFTYVNHTDTPAKCGHWQLYKLAAGQWHHIGPFMHTADCRVVPPGRTKTWTLHAFPEAGLECDAGHAFPYLGGGRYAVTAGYAAGLDASQTVAMVDVTGDPVTLTPTADVTHTTPTNQTVTATTDAWRTAPTADRAILTVTTQSEPDTTSTTPSNTSVRHFIAEQLMRDRHHGLRNALAVLTTTPTATTVRLKTDTVTARQAINGSPNPDTAFRFRFRKTTYTATVTSPDDSR